MIDHSDCLSPLNVATLIATSLAFYVPLLNWGYGRGEPQPLAQEGRGQAWLWRLIVWLPLLVFAFWAALLFLFLR